MKVVEEKKVTGRRIRREKPAAAGSSTDGRRARVGAAEQQIIEMERTFTDRWEW